MWRVARQDPDFETFAESFVVDRSLLSISCRTISRSEASGPSRRTASGACVIDIHTPTE